MIRPSTPDNGIEFNAITGWYMDEENAVTYKFLGNGKSCSGDWIGLYHEGFSSLDEYLVYEYIGRGKPIYFILFQLFYVCRSLPGLLNIFTDFPTVCISVAFFSK